MEYTISSRDYLLRARNRLREHTAQALFYAALELRCGIESRMSQYLDVWEHVSKRKKEGWRIADLARGVEEAFRLGNNIVRWPCTVLARVACSRSSITHLLRQRFKNMVNGSGTISIR